jgi:hypothetical protein
MGGNMTTTAQDNKTNTQFLNDWRTGKDVSTHRLGGANELLKQVCAIAMLDELTKAGYQVATWNAVSEAEWVSFKAATKAKIEATTSLSALTDDDIESAFNLGANYFEHGHPAIMNGTPVEDRVTLVKS